MSLTATPDRIIMYMSQYNDLIAERNALLEQVAELKAEKERLLGAAKKPKQGTAHYYDCSKDRTGKCDCLVNDSTVE